MSPIPPSPELFGTPVATWALGISLLSFGVALIALGWQVTKHFLDGGRVKVYLNTAVLEPEFLIAVNRSGQFTFKDAETARGVARGRSLELAQLVVENPGRVPVTVYSPGLSISGHGKKDHSLVPRLFVTESSFGADEATGETVVRLEPFGRVTFLLDYWSVTPRLLQEASAERIFLRGYVGVAGRTKRPQKSSWRRRWRVSKGAYTAIAGSPDFTPFGVMWRAMYVQLPEKVEDEPSRHPQAGPPITRGALRYILDEAMSRFDQRPDREELTEVLNEIATKHGDKYPMLGFSVLEAYEALDRMEGHLARWTEGLSYFASKKNGVAQSGTGGETQ